MCSDDGGIWRGGRSNSKKRGWGLFYVQNRQRVETEFTDILTDYDDD